MVFHNKEDFYRNVTTQRITKKKYSMSVQTILAKSIWPDVFLNMACIYNNSKFKTCCVWKNFKNPQLFCKTGQDTERGPQAESLVLMAPELGMETAQCCPSKLWCAALISDLPGVLHLNQSRGSAPCLPAPHMLGPNEKSTLRLHEALL